ncbi:hypothetical protein [Rhodobacter sp. 24-YEA-8]|uniref:hypothetical protein n=1 Tax=Rhodobacter sp. 24-YEA-8 TaxID=1884310 RepID=UPI0008985C09|nr:hypothetical protein [Rhodobacter sp. 24-YEA-8]SEB99994.1 hypothetical protein SAMN05519105_1742 [Rhodobacter sp. 24-YEA-8]
MDLNRLINMLVNMFLRKAVNKGIRTATDYAARRGKTEVELTPEERENARRMRDLTDRAKKVARLGRRL